MMDKEDRKPCQKEKDCLPKLAADENTKVCVHRNREIYLDWNGGMHRVAYKRHQVGS